jgi:hypothetical protein
LRRILAGFIGDEFDSILKTTSSGPGFLTFHPFPLGTNDGALYDSLKEERWVVRFVLGWFIDPWGDWKKQKWR